MILKNIIMFCKTNLETPKPKTSCGVAFISANWIISNWSPGYLFILQSWVEKIPYKVSRRLATRQLLISVTRCHFRVDISCLTWPDQNAKKCTVKKRFWSRTRFLMHQQFYERFSKSEYISRKFVLFIIAVV